MILTDLKSCGCQEREGQRKAINEGSWGYLVVRTDGERNGDNHVYSVPLVPTLAGVSNPNAKLHSGIQQASSELLSGGRYNGCWCGERGVEESNR